MSNSESPKGTESSVPVADPNLAPSPIAPESAPKPRTAFERISRYRNSLTPDSRLSKLQRAFVQEYLIDESPVNAMRRTGRGGKYPGQSAHYMLKLPHVAKAIADGIAEKDKAREVTVERLRARYAEFAFAKHEGPIHASHVLTALDRLGNHMGMFRPETLVQTPVQFTIIGGPPLPSESSSADNQRLELTSSAVDLIDKPEPKGR